MRTQTLTTQTVIDAWSMVLCVVLCVRSNVF